ncbi:MAG: 2-hydroxyacyl-CoA dehydratase [Candidatus Helarchaeota archaeon]
MSRLLQDFLHENTLNLMLDYYSGLKNIHLARARGNKICSVMLPFITEIIEASGCTSVSLYRLGRFIADRELRMMRLSKNLFGTKSLLRGLNFLTSTLGPNQLLKIAEKGILGGLWKIYHENIDTAKDAQYPIDACFGTRIYYGSLLNFKNEVDFSIGFGTRCGWLTKFYQATANIRPLTFIDLPIRFDDNALEYQKVELLRVIKEVEKITKRPFSEEKLKEEIQLHNSIGNSYSEILKIWAKNVTALGPLGFIYVLSMLHFGYADRLSKSSKHFDTLLKSLVTEFNTNLKIDLKDTPKLMLVPMFGGFDPQIMKITSDLGGRSLFADWKVIGFLDPIKEVGDPILNYSEYLLNVSKHWYDNFALIDNYIKVIKNLEIDGVVFNSIYGCKSMTPAYQILKDRLIEYEIPILNISFQNMDENLGQTQTRIGAFLEMIKS